MTNWQFDDQGNFTLSEPHRTRFLYFPLVSEAGMMSVVTPRLYGDIKAGQNSFLTQPVSVQDLHESRSARNFWVLVKDRRPWSATGNSAAQWADSADGDEPVSLQAGFLWHKITRESLALGLRAEIVNFVPPSEDRVELMRVTLSNVGHAPLEITPVAAIPLYGRSADNLRDHRHVTSLLHRIQTQKYGITVTPTLSFDERGHQLNRVRYVVLAARADGTAPRDFCPVLDDFVGEAGCLDWPEAVVKTGEHFRPAGQVVDGYEAMGAVRFDPVVLSPGESESYVLLLAILDKEEDLDELMRRYGSGNRFDEWFARNEAHWRGKVDCLSFHTGDELADRWVKWVTVQPVLRRLLGNSFLPFHDYGRGGRGWRDLWQDCLALLMLEPEGVAELLHSYYAGVRIDGSNATIIGRAPGEFIADRNNIARIWMDHGAWPFLTTSLYIDQTGDVEFLLRDQAFFKDAHVDRARGLDGEWHPQQGTNLRTAAGVVYTGSILEHLLVQHLTPFFNVGAHNNILLEDADWNDGMDMAPHQGESVAFTALYASNLRELSNLLCILHERGTPEVGLATELLLLLDSLGSPVEYELVGGKQARLREYLVATRHAVSGEKRSVATLDLARDLAGKADWLYEHLRVREWVTSRDGYGWFNGYYDDDGARVEGDHPNGTRMTLTGQVFPLMGGIATESQVDQVVCAADHFLSSPQVGGYRLNTDFGNVMLNLGRCFGYAFGTKENGAMFSHMAVMFANALYKRGRTREGYKVLHDIYRHCADFETSRIYPGIPEYIDARGRGAYPWLTGSASWFLLTLLAESFGVRGSLGELLLAPQLVAEQFDARGDASVETEFAGRKIHVIYHNPTRLDSGAYRVDSVTLNGEAIPFLRTTAGVIISRPTLSALSADTRHRIDVSLAPRMS